MLRLPHGILPGNVAGRLAAWQAEVDAALTHADRVSLAKARFEARNKPRNATFRAVRQALGLMCPGNQRCGYCEDSAANQIEHIAPKAHFPELAFVWANYLYACSPCNGPKNDKYAVREASGNVVELSRQRGSPPPPGTPLLIDPRGEDPLGLLELDLAGTFEIVPVPTLGADDSARAKWNIDTLDLNRPYLTRGREDAFGNFRARLVEYAALRDAASPRAKLDDLRGRLLTLPHPTVFREMQRQAAYDPSIRDVFANVPEALAW